MRRRSPRQPSAAQMIRDYLGAVSTAATRKLPKGDRLLFVGRTRAALEAQVGPLASADDADRVAAALTALGDPDELAAKERERLYSARRRGAAAEPPTLWKPPGKTSRRAAPPAKPPRSGPAEPRSASAPGESRPRRSRTWPYRRSEPDDAALPGVPPTPSGSGPPEPGRPGPVNPEPEQPGPGTGGPGSDAHIPPPRQSEEPPGPAIRPAPPGWDAHRDGTQPGTATGPAAAGRDGAPPGRKPGTVGPGTARGAGWLGPAGTPGPGTPTGTAGPGAANGTAGPGVSGRSVGPGASGGSVGPGASGRAVGPGASGPSVGPGGNYGAVGPAVQNGHNGTAGPGTQNGAAPGGLNGTAAPGSQAGRTAPGRPAPAGPDAGPAAQPGAAPPDGTKRRSIVPGLETPGPADDEPAGRRFGPPVPLTEAWLLARKNPLEAVAVVVLGIGGLLLPFPLWLVGAVIAIFSKRWGKRDKWLALIGPPGFAVICMLLLGISGGGNFFHALATASHQFGLLLRVGSLLSAGYLVWRLRRGPGRRKTPPWMRGR